MQLEQQYKTLEKELQQYLPILSKASDAILDQDVSDYPIFVLHREGVDIGIPIQSEGSAKGWMINASTLEEFVTKQLIQTERIDNFKEAYKDSSLFVCLFVVENGGATFVFLPRN